MENNMICNACGKRLIVENDIPKEDFLAINKNWGYFSKKDGKTHRCIICEACFDKYAGTFAVPVEVTETKELL